MVFCDISKVLDIVWHRGLLLKLKQNGIDGNLLKWITNYLDNRQQNVVVKSSSSSVKPVTAGVPQGSVLGPLLFLLYVNDIADSLLSLVRLFADDSSLYFSSSSLQDIDGIINYDLCLLSAWARQWFTIYLHRDGHLVSGRTPGKKNKSLTPPSFHFSSSSSLSSVSSYAPLPFFSSRLD